MKTEGRLSVVDVFVGIRDPRQAKKVEHDLVELLVIAVCGVLAGADDFVEIEAWANEKCDWFRRYLRLRRRVFVNGAQFPHKFGVDVLKAVRDGGIGFAVLTYLYWF